MRSSQYALGIDRRRRWLDHLELARTLVDDREAKIFVDVTARVLRISPEVAQALLSIAPLGDVIDAVHRRHRLGSVFSQMGSFGAVMDECHAEATLRRMLARAHLARAHGEAHASIVDAGIAAEA